MSSDLVVRLELAVLRPHGIERRRARHVLRGRSVHVTESDGQMDAEPVRRTVDIGVWRDEIATACVVDVPPDGPAFPRDGVLLPWDLLVASGTGPHRGRADVEAELRARAGPFADAYDTLLRATQGRLRAVGTARGRVGWVSWVLGAEGWLALSPCTDVGPFGARAMVRLDRRQPGDLSRDVAHWMVRSQP
jgi:hypothetical protein